VTGLSRSPEQPEANKYGPLEYGLLAGLGLLAVFFLYLLFGADARAWLQDFFTREQAATGPQFEVVEQGDFIQTIEEEEIPVRNCGAAQEQDFELERIRTFQHEIILPESLDGQAVQILQTALERHYTLAAGLPVERRYVLRMTAGPDSAANYLIEWHGRWVEGEIVVTWEDGEQDRVPYQVLLDLEFFFQSSQSVPCP
jgi:hypothetical protein